LGATVARASLTAPFLLALPLGLAAAAVGPAASFRRSGQDG
jgi:hypothetical protein